MVPTIDGACPIDRYTHASLSDANRVLFCLSHFPVCSTLIAKISFVLETNKREPRLYFVLYWKLSNYRRAGELHDIWLAKISLCSKPNSSIVIENPVIYCWIYR